MAANSVMAAIPTSRTALETYLGFLETSESATEKESLTTPHIDRVLHSYQHRAEGGRDGRRGRGPAEERRGERRGSGDNSSSSKSHWEGGGYESRLMQLERQLSQLLQKSKQSARKRPPGTKQPQPGSPSTSSESSADETTPHSLKTPTQTTPTTDTTQPVVLERATKTRASPPASQRTTVRERGVQRRWKSVRVEKENVPSVAGSQGGRVRGKPASVRAVREGGKRGGGGRREEGEAVMVSSIQEDQQVKTRLVMESQRRQESSQKDASVRELEEERERRSKAEMAAGRLVEHVRSLQTQLQESSRGRETAVARAARLDGELRRERERVGALEEESRKLQESMAVAGSELEAVRMRAGERESALRVVEEEGRTKEATHISERTELLGRVREAELASSGHRRETEMVRGTVSELRQQLQQMQELLAVREREHQKTLQGCKPLDGREVQALVSREVERERERAEGLVEQHKQRLVEQQKAYQALEEEFRMGLRIEASRYQELQQCYEGVRGQVEGYREATEAALRKEGRATQVVAELTAIVREQKGRLAELARAKQDTVQELKERVGGLEAGVRDKHKLEVKVQSLQEENSRLGSQVAAQESVLEGLRGERQLWSRELAQQGAELAQDRGRMEAQIEALSLETASLREELQRARDSVRIKEKVVADQQASISQLREALAAREREGQEARLDWEQEQQSLQLQLEQETEASAHLQEELSAVTERKRQLKEELSAVREELAQWQTKYSKLRGEWEERVKVIGNLEESLAQVQETFSQREAALLRDRDQAALSAKEAEEKLGASEETHHKQLEAQQTSHDSHMTQLVQQKNREIEEANQRVCVVEGEMKELLSEVTREKRAMEGRVQRLSLALHKLQQDIST